MGDVLDFEGMEIELGLRQCSVLARRFIEEYQHSCYMEVVTNKLAYFSLFNKYFLCFSCDYNSKDKKSHHVYFSMAVNNTFYTYKKDFLNNGNIILHSDHSDGFTHGFILVFIKLHLLPKFREVFGISDVDWIQFQLKR